jgi:hypothetical protein
VDKQIREFEFETLDGQTAVMYEPHGGADMELQGLDPTDDGKNLEVVAKYVHACLKGLKSGTKTTPVPFEAFCAWQDFYRDDLMAQNRVASYGPIVELDMTCMKQLGGCGKESHVTVDLNDREVVAPETKLASSEVEGVGTVALIPKTLEVEQALLNADESTDTLALRVAEIDGEPFGTMRQWPGRVLRKIRPLITRFDGDAGLVVMLPCAHCGKKYPVTMTSVPDFLGMA